MTERTATMVVDLGFGDAGKGTVVDFLARKGGVAAVVRFNGGSQAAHNVVTADGRHHTFSQFGSALFVPGVETYLSQHMLFDPEQIQIEAYELMQQGVRDPLARLTVHEDALVVSPFHVAANIVKEYVRGVNRDGTCGRGIGETMRHALAHPDDAIRVKDLKDGSRLLKKLRTIQAYYEEDLQEVPQKFHEILRSPFAASRFAEDVVLSMKTLQVVSGTHLKSLSKRGDLLFEGAQGVLLDEWHGFHPHTTWSKTNADNAEGLLSEIGFEGERVKLGVIRSYFTRHGEGPFPTEDTALRVPELHNGEVGHQGKFRRGWFDAVLAKYAIDACGGIDMLAMTHLDSLTHMGTNVPIGIAYQSNGGKTCTLTAHRRGGPLDVQDTYTEYLREVTPVYQMETHTTGTDYAASIASILGVKLGLLSRGPTAGDKIVL
jgi:adenylosuccinate synthase